jgi:drug/metabolite transporter (DMT)-like permease
VFAIAHIRRDLRPLSRQDLLRLACIGLLFFGHWLTYFFSVKISSASIGAIGLSTYGVDLLILGALFRESRIHASDVVAVVLAAAGAILVVPEFRLDNAVALGMMLACASAMLYAALPILHRRWSHLGTSTRALGQFSFALLFFLLFVTESSWSLRPVDWAGLIFLAIGPTLIGHTLWVRVTTRLAPPLTSIINYGSIPVAVGLGVLVLGEPLTARTVGGALLILGGGIFGLTQQWRRAGKEAEAVSDELATEIL